MLPKALTRFRAPWQWNGGPAVLQSRATDDTGMVQPSRAQFVAERGLRGNYHYNAIASWRIDQSRGGEQCVCLIVSRSAPRCCWPLPRSTAMAADEPHFGKPMTPADIAAWDISIGPDGAGLPPGKGNGDATARPSSPPSARHATARRAPASRTTGWSAAPARIAPGKAPVKTVGSYWPYATTLFDYVRRAMPWDRPKSLSDEEVYAVAAYVLYLNGVIGQDDVIDAQSLPKVKMPNRDGFTAFPRWPPPK